MRRFALLLVLAVGCASAEKRVEQGQEAEQEGRWEEATHRYLDALRKDPGYPGAREKATQAGSRAVADYLKTAAGMESSGQYDRAVTEYRRVDALVAACAAQRVVLSVPGDYQQRRDGVFQRAFDATATSAETAAAAGDWARALDLWRRADAQYEPDAPRIQRSREGRLAALLTGATTELNAGRYAEADSLADAALQVYGPDSPRSKEAREVKLLIVATRYRDLVKDTREAMGRGAYQEAYGLVAQAIEVHGESSPASEEARQLRDEIIEKGTVRVAVAAVWRQDEIGAQTPPGLTDRLDEILAEAHWTNPPLFVSVTDPESVRNEMKRLDYHREVLSSARAAALGEELGVDLVAVPYFVQCRLWARGKPQVRTVPTTTGGQATLKLRRERRLTVRCYYDLVSVATREKIASAYIDGETASGYDWATVEGFDPRKLRLTQQEHAWLDPTALAEADAALANDLALELAPGLADSIFSAVLKRLP